MKAPLIIVDNEQSVASVGRRVARGGWAIHPGFVLPDSPWDLASARVAVCGVAMTSGQVSEVVMAAARGAGVVVYCPVPELHALLRSDLSRIGPVSMDGPASDPGDGLPLDEQQRLLLERLAAGESINAAATAEFISLRTANRRLSQARVALGVRTTREAVLAYVARSNSDRIH